MVREIPLTRGKVALVDDDDFDLVSTFKWCASQDRRTWYAQSVHRVNGRRVHVRLHRIVLGVNDRSQQVDHVNGNGLDCRRCNLRIATSAQNAMNRKTRVDSKSGMKGVKQSHGCLNRWTAHIKRDGRHIHVGSFSTPEDAARAYDQVARRLFGEFARTNYGS